MAVPKAIRTDSGSLIEASSFLIDRGYCGLVWLDQDLIVSERTGNLVEFVTIGEPMGLSVVALFGCEDDIQELRQGRRRRFELLNIRTIGVNGEGHRLNFYAHWLETSGRFLLIVLRSTAQADMEAEIENQSRRRIAAEEKVIEQRNQLTIANAELTRANRELTEFANVIAHDLKSPMRAMRYHAEDLAVALSREDRNTAFSRLADLQQQSRRMSRMLTDLLTYAMIGRAEEAMEPTDTRALAEAIIASLPRPRGFSIELNGNWPVLETAGPALDVVLRNLVDNAIKHHDKTVGRITLTATPGETMSEFAVADDGPGIPTKFHEVIFLPFRRLDMQQVSETSGSGIGLSLVRKTAETAGATLTLESDPAVRRGTVFRLIWPGRIMAQ